MVLGERRERTFFLHNNVHSVVECVNVFLVQWSRYVLHLTAFYAINGLATMISTSRQTMASRQHAASRGHGVCPRVAIRSSLAPRSRGPRHIAAAVRCLFACDQRP